MKTSKSVINIPNVLSIIRILLTPVFVIFLLKGMFVFSLWVFFIAAVSDGLDGFIAKCFNQRTVLGSYLDPIADKMLLSAAFVSLAILKIIPPWLTVIVISRDIIIVMGVIVIFQIFNIRVVPKPSFVSKCTTFSQLSTIIVTLLNPDISSLVLIKNILFYITALLTVSSGLHYIYMGLNMLGPINNNNKKNQNQKKNQKKITVGTAVRTDNE